MTASRNPQDNNRASWDHSTHEAFLRYYEEEHLSDHATKRFAAIRNTVLRALAHGDQVLDVLDVGCGPGTQSLVWAELGHRVGGLDVSEQFVAVAKKRAEDAWNLARYPIDYARQPRGEYIPKSVENLTLALRLSRQALVLLP